MFTIGKLVRQADVSADTVRYYEQQGLLSPATRTAAGYRLYDSRALRRLHFVRRAQQAGFSLAEIGELLVLKQRDAACCRDVRSVALEKKLQLEHKIKMLRSLSQALTDLIGICHDETRPLDQCPILAALENSVAEPVPVPG